MYVFRAVILLTYKMKRITIYDKKNTFNKNK